MKTSQVVLSCALLLACCLTGCTEDSPSRKVANDGEGDRSGQTGSPGESECSTDSDCRSALDQEVASLARAEQESRRFVGGTCEQVSVAGVGSGLSCVCQLETGGSMSVGPAGAGCFAVGRAGDCLWDDSELPSCKATEGCDGVCQELLTRLQKDKARTFAAEVQHSACETKAGHCQNVLRIGERCYANGSYRQGKSYDCSLGVAKILEESADTH